MQQEQVDYFLIFEGDLLVAFLAIQNLVGEIEITNIAVLPDYQGKGLASRLMGNLSDASESVFLEVRESNHKAQALYRKHGFECVGKRPNYYKEPAEAALIMKREGSHDR